MTNFYLLNTTGKLVKVDFIPVNLSNITWIEQYPDGTARRCHRKDKEHRDSLKSFEEVIEEMKKQGIELEQL